MGRQAARMPIPTRQKDTRTVDSCRPDLPVMRRWIPITALLVLVTGCAPALSPLYRDYEDENGGDEVYSRIERALESSGWTVVDGVTSNVVATEPRTFRSWGLYSVEVQLEVAPLAGDHVRVFVNPYRRFFQGTRRKVPYMRKSWARSSIRKLSEAFDEEGLTFRGTAQQRAKDAGVR
ncbi:MAG: hypothetical protein ACI80V_000261 [Rhodothermales bacterium]|jgi:hypothetical protein